MVLEGFVLGSQDCTDALDNRRAVDHEEVQQFDVRFEGHLVVTIWHCAIVGIRMFMNCRPPSSQSACWRCRTCS